MDQKKLSFLAKLGKAIGFIIGLVSLPIIALLIVELILLMFVLALDDLKAVAFILQFPATFFIWTGRKR